MAQGILIYGELQKDRLDSMTLELLGAGRKLAAELGQEVGVIFLGDNAERSIIREAICFGADKVYKIDDARLKEYNPELFSEAMHHVCRELEPDIVLFGQTSMGRELAPRLAFRLKTGLVMDCIDLKIEPKAKLLIRVKPVYGGNAIASYIGEMKPQLATLRAKAKPPAERDISRQGKIISLGGLAKTPSIRTKVVQRVEEKEGAGKLLESAQVVVCGGRGIGSAENFSLLQELASVLKGAVGATRPPCDLGWVSSELQIGLTGKTIAPSLYIGVALSGSGAHLAGFSNAKSVFAINNDPEANIFRVAEYGLVADYKQVMPLIIATCRELASRF